MSLLRGVRTVLVATGLFISLFAFFAAKCSAAFANTALPKAKHESDAKELVLIKSHDEILTKAKIEAKLRVMTGLLGSVKATTEAFRRKYPFIDFQEIRTIRSGENAQQAFLEISAGTAKRWDIARTYTDQYSEYLPHLWKVDLLSMAEQGTISIPPRMIDPTNRNVVALLSRFQVTAYNKDLIPSNQVPKTWEDVLKPEFKGKKFAVDVRSQELASLVPAWGLDKVLDFARKLAAQQPIWVRGGTRELVSVASGEIPMFLGPNYGSVIGVQRKDRAGKLDFAILEPVPVRVGTEQAILATSNNPHTALLWLEFMASREAQKLIDQNEPLSSSFHVQGSEVEQKLKGKKLSIVSWEENQKMEQWISKIVEAFGFPRAEAK
jgi:ABC-type Fe3+ transport system substrate-binding protein